MIGGAAEIRAQRHVPPRARRHQRRASGKIYGIRFDIFKRKFFVKFLNNFLAQITPFFFYSVGGYLVIKGSLSLGALVAVLAAYKDILDAVEGAPHVVLDEGGRPRSSTSRSSRSSSRRACVDAKLMEYAAGDGPAARRRDRRERLDVCRGRRRPIASTA